MRNKGAIWTLAIALALVCIYQLSFTVVTYKVKRDSREYATGADNIVDLKKADYYLDSIATEPVYNFVWLKKYSYRECQEREINLGLDLQGGMNVILEVSLVDVVKSMANYSKDTTFNKALALAKKNQVGSNENFVTLFGQAFEQIDPNARLSAIFTSAELRELINYNTSNADVIGVIREEADKAIANSFNIINTRIDHFGVASPNVQRLQSGDRILVELPGVSEKDRVRKLLQGAARLEFWETYDNTDGVIRDGLMALNNLIRELNKSTSKTPSVIDSPATGQPAVTETDTEISDTTGNAIEGTPSLLQQLTEDTTGTNRDSAATAEAFFQENPLYSVLMPYVTQNNELIPGSIFGQVHIKDTAKVNQYLRLAMQRGLFPRNFKYFWSAKPVETSNANKPSNYYEIHAIKITSRDNRAPLTGDVIDRAVNEFDQNSAEAFVSMDMNAEGTRIWARMTRENVGKILAVVMDDYVYSNPRVNEEIPNGSTRISGNFTAEEAEDLANLLKSGTMPAPCTIIQEEVIGPSLGKESVKSGINSLIISFILIFSFMVFYYTRRAGLVADIALFLNMFFLFGVLASLGLSLTLPGIAGIVLTIGMSVDANVLIFERIREELAAGKGVRMAVSDGYKNALSAIIDGNLTTLITGIILFVLGTGPVKGFATTLVVGIITSLFAAIFISRLIFEIMLDSSHKLTFSTKLSTGAFKNINIDYIKHRKKFYFISGAVILIGVVSLFTRGLDPGVDFAGGRNYIIQFDKPVSNLEVASMVETELGMRPTVITYGSEDKVRITTKYGIESEDPEIENQIEQKIYNGVKPLLGEVSYEQFKEENVKAMQKVGPTIAADIKRDSIIAVVVALFFMFLYIGFRFRNWNFGLGAMASLAHDAFFVIGMFSLLYGIMPFSMELDQTFIAAILTIIGYSVNDTVVIFDRIREYRVLHPKMEYAALMNKAINDTFSRTIITSLTVLITVAIIFFYTGESVRGFAFALLLGLFSGVYSTIFIATTIVYDTSKQKAMKK